MDTIPLIAFVSAKLILAISPGPGVLATVAISLSSGFRPALPLITGIIIGDIFYLMVTVTGLSAAAQEMGELFLIIKICGGAYFMWLGLKLCFSKPPDKNPEMPPEKKSDARRLISGILITLSNPKVILFYYGFLPTPTQNSVRNSLEISIIIVAVIAVLAMVLLTYACLAVQAQRKLFNDQSALKRLNQASGAVLFATGIFIMGKS